MEGRRREKEEERRKRNIHKQKRWEFGACSGSAAHSLSHRSLFQVRIFERLRDAKEKKEEGEEEIIKRRKEGIHLL